MASLHKKPCKMSACACALWLVAALTVAHTAAAARPLAGRALLLTGSSGSSTSSTSSSTSTSSGSGFNWRRALRQVTDSFTTQGGNPYNNPLQIYAHAHEAEAWSHAKAIGIFQKHPSATVVTAGDQYPTGRSQALTQNGQQRGGTARSTGGFVTGNPVTLFGQTAIASTELGARAFAGSNAIPMVDREPGALRAAVANTNRRWDAVPGRSGRRGIGFEYATGYTERAPLSSGISNNGGGPMASASAGEAVAMSFADTPENDRWGGGGF